MSWQKLNIENAKINFSKVVPYDASMTLLEEKQGYFHNNRLTALRRYATSGLPGYKCYKRPPKWLDGEYTSYIEINKVVDGELVPLMEISDSYYRCVSEDYEGADTAPVFYSGVVIDNTLIGKQQDWQNTVFYTIGNHQFLAWHKDTNKVERLICYQKTSTNYDENRSVEYVGISTDIQIVSENNTMYVFDRSTFNTIWNEKYNEERTSSFTDYDNRVKFDGQWSMCFKHGNKEGTVDTLETRGLCFNLNDNSRVAEATFGIKYSRKHKDVYIGSSKGLQWLSRISINDLRAKGDYEIREQVDFVDGYNSSFSTGEMMMFDDNPYRLKVTASYNDTAFDDRELHTTNINTNFLLQDSYIGSRLDYRCDFYNGGSSTSYPSAVAPISSNYVSDTKQINNGFVINYTNKLQVSLGHRYKTIARLDTQGASYLGSDSNNVYIRQNSKNYRIWIDKMFPEVPYNAEVNIIENGDLCQRVGGYKIFNTTTYYNAIYNDDPSKVCCSCDDWNGRYISTTRAVEDPTLLSTSRVGHFWNSTASFDNIPAKAISSELTDQLEYAHPEYNWVNPNYTIHEGTTAYIYTAESTQIDRKLQQWEITSDGFKPVKDETKIFNHNLDSAGLPLYQIVPSILFSNTLKSDAIYALQVGSEVHLLKQYQYSQTTPALVYDDEATAVNIDPSARYMILQGAFYTSAGADDSIRIYNPYDTMMFEGVKTYCCDVTGLRYLGYDTTQAYYYSPATGNIYTFNGANKLNKFLEVDKREPLASGVIASGHVGIDICNIPSMNIIGMAFNDGVLLIIDGQSVFIDAQNVQTLEANKELGLIKINSDYYYFGTNSLAANIGTTVADEAIELKLKTVKVGTDRLNNQTIPKHRIVVYSDTVDKDNKAEVIITLTSRLGDKIYTETHRKSLSHLDFVENEYQLEFNPKQTKSNYIQVAVSLSNADLVEYWLDINDGSEENLVRSK